MRTKSHVPVLWEDKGVPSSPLVGTESGSTFTVPLNSSSTTPKKELVDPDRIRGPGSPLREEG